jgi:toxin-antitoxin system PIN domain toxin
MILIDANLLIYAYNVDFPQHEAAKRWLEETLSASKSVGVCWVVLLAFLRITTHKKAFPHPLPREEAEEIMTKWLDQPCVEILEPGEEHWSILRRLMAAHDVTGPLVMDTHLAALALTRDATLYSTDGDFRRFEEQGLCWVNPLVESPSAR